MTDNSLTEYGIKTPKNTIEKSSLKETVTIELERLGTTRKWVWLLLFLALTPNILNGFHVSSYIFLAHLPKDMWCGIDELNAVNWTTEEIRDITENGLTSKGCSVWDWNYSELSQMSYQDALAYTKMNKAPAEVSCSSRKNSFYEYDERDTTIVTEWDLVCDKSVQRTSAQVILSFGKFIGASAFGIVSDKYGRRTSFIIGTIIYITGSLLTIISPWYSLFLAGRFGLGISTAGLYYPIYAWLSENISVKYRALLSNIFGTAYPLGMFFLAISAYLVHPWRYLQITLTVPTIYLIIVSFVIFESPRWLLMKNRFTDAYRVVFKTKEKDCDILSKYTLPVVEETKKNDDGDVKVGFLVKLKGCFKELTSLYGPRNLRIMALSCNFLFFVSSFCYYVTALNASNIPVSPYLYVAITGCVDIPGYIFPALILRVLGRRAAACSLFVFSGTALLLVLVMPQDCPNLIVSLAMVGRFGVTAVYSTVTLFTAELFPTQIRNSALGACSTIAHIGSMTAPYIVDILGAIDWYIPTTICGFMVLLAGCLTLTLPETSTRNLQDHVKEVTSIKTEKK